MLNQDFGGQRRLVGAQREQDAFGLVDQCPAVERERDAVAGGEERPRSNLVGAGVRTVNAAGRES
jgi:hypothetical protein